MEDPAAVLRTQPTAKSSEDSGPTFDSREKQDLPRKRARSKWPLWDRRDRKLSPKHRAWKTKFLRAVSLARRSKANLDEFFRQEGIDPNQVLAKTSVVKRVKGRIVPKVRDTIPRSMRFYENGGLRHAEIANSEVASDIGHYWNVIGELTETGKSRPLRSLKRRRFKDLQGHFHTLEKDPKMILDLEARRPKRELHEIYAR